MIIKKSGNMIFGAILNAKEKKALDIEMKKAAAKTLDNMEKDIDVMIHQNHRVSICHKIPHYAGQSLQI